MTAIYNFSAGPAVLPRAVLQQVQQELVDWHGSGMSVMEMSHRGKEFMGIAAEAEVDLREVMGIPSNYKVLFLQGGASSQFAMVPMNLLRGKPSADYLNTGEWSKKAIKEAKKYGNVNVVASSEDKNFSYAPVQDQWKLDPNAAYVHYTPNETIGGVEIFWTPDTGSVPLVADMSSHILSRPVNVEKFGLIYAGAQKNIGPSGLVVLIVRRDLLERAGHKAVAPNKSIEYTRVILNGLGAQHFPWVVGGDNGFGLKPEPGMLLHLLEQVGVPKERAILVGDSTNDINGGHNAGIRVCAVGYGMGNREKMAACQPDWFIERPEQLMEIFT